MRAWSSSRSPSRSPHRHERSRHGPERRDEDFPFQPIAAPDFYARSKRLAEDVVREAATHRDLDVVALRPTVIYGERDRLFTPRVIRAARLRVVPQIGPGTNRLSCV